VKDFTDWDEFSDQPKIIKDRGRKFKIRAKHWIDYVKMALTSLLIYPVALLHMSLKSYRGNRLSVQMSSERFLRSNLFGVGVSLERGSTQFDLVEELGIEHVLIRFPLKHMHRISEYREFAAEFRRRGKTILLNILQTRAHIINSNLLERDIALVFRVFQDLTDEFQIGNAINRLKWGFASPGEYLEFYKVAQQVRDSDFPTIKLIGPAVIDFEYHFTIRALFNRYKLKFDRLSALLYVDRNGSPDSSQFGIFNTDRKIRLLESLRALSNKVKWDGIYITEVNWPLKGTAPYAPTSEAECVEMEEYCQYMRRYYEIAAATKCIRRVYWHQLIAPGYGLVDNREQRVQKTAAFISLKSLLIQLKRNEIAL
jgi:hypothetical protein